MVEADLVAQNGIVFTADPSSLFAQAVAISKGKFVAVGDVADHIGPRTEVIDLQGCLLTPGFTDAHVHPATSGLDRLRISFEGCDDASDALAAVAEYASAHPDKEWLVGSGWLQSWFERGCPDAASLDVVVGDRPALIANSDGHGAWVSSAALRLAGLTSDTPDPPDGRIERRSDGSPQGTLHEGAIALVEKHAPIDTVEDFELGLIRGQRELLSFGITGWQDAAIGPEVQEAYLRLASSDRLVGEAVGALWWDRHRGLSQVDELLERREQWAGRFRPTSVKLMLDGVAENFTASLLDPYLDGSGSATSNSGVNFIDPDELKDIVTVLDGHGFQCHFHALGDAAVRSALDAIEAALRANGADDNRHHLAHIQFVHPDDVPRFSQLNAVANAQPLWACNDDYQIDLTRPFITAERDGWQYPFGSLLRNRARLAMGSDWGVSTANVMEQIEVATTRKCAGRPALNAEEALTPVQALSAFTIGSAYVNHSEGRRGSISVGKDADMAVFDRNPLVEGPLSSAEVTTTFVSGEIVHER